MLKRISFLLLILLYIGAGINHFWHPDFYFAIIPSYLPNPYNELVCIPLWEAWLRLAFQPVLILWVLWQRK
ncbi:MAG TPA: hypothetical protein VMU83_12410 [Hanamia sp.]|nr:hypothetical protein [Hanamia sp.]